VINKKKAIEYLQGIKENKFKYVIIYFKDNFLDDNNEDFLKVRDFVNV
jgi:hypothetical protein